MRRKTVAIIIMCVIVAGIFFFIKSNNIRDTEMPVDTNTYENVNNFPYEELEFVDSAAYKILKKEYEQIDFSSEFIVGENKFHKEYLQLIMCEKPFVTSEQQEIYLNQFGQMNSFMLSSYNLEELTYYYYDADGDNISELGVTDGVNFIYVFDYDEEDEKITLCQDLCSTWYRIIGTKKITWNNGGTDILFYTSGQRSDEKKEVRFFSKEFFKCLLIFDYYFHHMFLLNML